MPCKHGRLCDAATVRVFKGPAVADDITEATFGADNNRLECLPGALRVGADLRQANSTIRAAKEWCLGNVTCAGFTTRANANATCPDAGDTIYEVYFKSRAGGNTDRAWVTWTKPSPPGTLVATGPPGKFSR